MTERAIITLHDIPVKADVELLCQQEESGSVTPIELLTVTPKVGTPDDLDLGDADLDALEGAWEDGNVEDEEDEDDDWDDEEEDDWDEDEWDEDDD